MPLHGHYLFFLSRFFILLFCLGLFCLDGGCGSSGLPWSLGGGLGSFLPWTRESLFGRAPHLVLVGLLWLTMRRRVRQAFWLGGPCSSLALVRSLVPQGLDKRHTLKCTLVCFTCTFFVHLQIFVFEHHPMRCVNPCINVLCLKSVHSLCQHINPYAEHIVMYGRYIYDILMI